MFVYLFLLFLITFKDCYYVIFYLVSFIVALLLFNFFCDEVLRSIVHDFNVDLPLNLVDLSPPLCKCKFKLKSSFFREEKYDNTIN